MKSVTLLNQIAATDSTFTLDDGYWTGKCLICNGWISFDTQTGYGANVEHIVPRVGGGGNDLHNLGITHPGCNGEKGQHWDARRRQRDPERYQALIQRLLDERARRWCDPAPRP